MKPDWNELNPHHLPPKADEPPLFAAARAGNHDEIRRLISVGADPNEVFDIQLDPGAQDWPATPLMVAAGSGDGATVETVLLLMELGADPRMQTTAGSAATFACEGLSWNYTRGGDASRLEACLAAGAPIPTEGPAAERLMAHAARLGDAERLRVMIASGMPVNVIFDSEQARKDHERFNARADTCGGGSGSDEVATGEDNDSQCADRCDADAIDRQVDAQMLEYAMAGPSWLAIPLFQAAESGSAECVRVLLDAGADIEQRDNSRGTALWYAETAEIASLLVERGLNIEESDSSGMTPLAANVDSLPRVRALLATGADPNAADAEGYTVLMCAVSHTERSPETIRALVAAGADPHRVSNFGYNAFHAAIDVNFEANAEESVRGVLGVLSELGVNIEHVNNGGQTPLARAIEHGLALEVQVLCELGANPNTPARKQMCCGGNPANTVMPPLHMGVDAVECDSVVRSLLRAGANPLVKNEDGYEAMHIAVSRLCATALDHESAWHTILCGLRDIRPTQPTFETRDELIEHMRALVHAFLTSFAEANPLPDPDEFDEEQRARTIEAISLLVGYRVGFSATEA